jgi:hypothetical protein
LEFKLISIVLETLNRLLEQMRLLNIKINKMHLFWDCDEDCGAELLIMPATTCTMGHFSGCYDSMNPPLSCLITHAELRAFVIMYRLYIPLIY